MLSYLKKYWYWCILAPVFMLGEIYMDLLQPKLMAQIIDNGVLNQNMQIIVKIGVQMIILVVFGGICGVLSGIFAQIASQNFGNDLRKDLFKKIMNLSFQQTDKISTGSLVTRITNDVNQVQGMVSMSVRAVIRFTAMFLGGIFMLSQQSIKFGIIVICALPMIITTIFFFIKKASPMFSIIQKRLDDVNNVMQENVAGSRVVKAFVKEEYEQNCFDNANNSLCSINLKVQTFLAYMSPLMNIVLSICTVLILVVSGYTVKNDGNISPGQIMAAITYLSMILHAIMFMANIFQTLTRAKASVERINEVLNSPEILADGNFDKNTKPCGEIKFENIHFSYPDSKNKEVLNNINLTIHSKETFAILGSTGSGKSSLVHLIPRFYDATAGNVYVDGINVKDYNIKVLREKIAIVMQKAELYSRSIKENIAWGDSSANINDIKKAAVIAQADKFISETTDGYDTLVTESGHSLSGGQKQRISISRAVLKKAEIIIFDDSTSALDLKTEANLYTALRNEYPDITKIIIAQRIASVERADRIAVIDNGQIVACDTHKNLLKNSQIYQDIYYSQMKKEEDFNV